MENRREKKVKELLRKASSQLKERSHDIGMADDM
jgi:hypothetical protein